MCLATMDGSRDTGASTSEALITISPTIVLRVWVSSNLGTLSGFTNSGSLMRLTFSGTSNAINSSPLSLVSLTPLKFKSFKALGIEVLEPATDCKTSKALAAESASSIFCERVR